MSFPVFSKSEDWISSTRSLHSFGNNLILSSVDLFEKYKCDRCNTEFRIVSKLQLTTELGFPGNFNLDYITKIDKSLFDDKD